MISRYSRTSLILLAVALYGGPVLAGLAGHPLAVLPVFFALFLLYAAATRKPDLSLAAGWAGLVLIAAVQATLVGLAFGLGLMLAPLIGALALPQWAPLLLTTISAVFGAWAFRDAAEMDVMLDSAIRALEEVDATARDVSDDPWPEPVPAAFAALERALGALSDVQGLTPERVDPIVRKLQGEAGVEAFDPFYDAAGNEDETGDGDVAANDPVVDYALLRFVAVADIRDALILRGEAGLAPSLMLNAPDPAVRGEARARIDDLLAAGAPIRQLPDPIWLTELAADYPGEGFEALARRCARN